MLPPIQAHGWQMIAQRLSGGGTCPGPKHGQATEASKPAIKMMSSDNTFSRRTASAMTAGSSVLRIWAKTTREPAKGTAS